MTWAEESRKLKNKYTVKNGVNCSKVLFQDMNESREIGALGWKEDFFFFNGKRNIFVGRGKGAFGEEREGTGEERVHYRLTDLGGVWKEGDQECALRYWHWEGIFRNQRSKDKRWMKVGELPGREDRCWGKIYHVTSDISLKRENPFARNEEKGERRKDVE